MKSRRMALLVLCFVFTLGVAGCGGQSCQFPDFWPNPPGPKFFAALDFSIPHLAALSLSGQYPPQAYLFPGTLNIPAVKAGETIRILSYLETHNVPMEVWDGKQYIPVSDPKAAKAMEAYIVYTPAPVGKVRIAFNNADPVAPILEIDTTNILKHGAGAIQEIKILTEVGGVRVFKGGENSSDGWGRRFYVREAGADATAPVAISATSSGNQVKLELSEELGYVQAQFLPVDGTPSPDAVPLGALFMDTTINSETGSVTYKVQAIGEMIPGVKYNLVLGKTLDSPVAVYILFVGVIPIAMPQELTQDLDGNVLDCGVGAEVAISLDDTDVTVCKYGEIGGP